MLKLEDHEWVAPVPYIVRIRQKDGSTQLLPQPSFDATPEEGEQVSLDLPGARALRARVTMVAKAYTKSPSRELGWVDLVVAEGTEDVSDLATGDRGLQSGTR